MSFDAILHNARQQNYDMTIHALVRMTQRGIHEVWVRNTILNGESEIKPHRQAVLFRKDGCTVVVAAGYNGKAAVVTVYT